MLGVTLCLFFILLYCVYDCFKPKNFPPGPAWLPLLGCFPMFHWLHSKYRHNYLVFEEWAHTYGPVLGLKLGSQKMVVISTHNLVKKCLLQDDFNGRPDGFFFRMRSFGKRKGIVFAEGIVWSECRKFTMRYLRKFGVGQSTMTRHLTLEARALVNHLRQLSLRGAVQMNNVFDVAVLNSLWCMFAGHGFEHNDTKLHEVLAVVHEAFRLFDTMGGLINQMPFLRFIIPELSGYNDLMRILEKLWSFLDEEIEIHENALANDSEPHDLIDAFLLEIRRRNGEKNTNFDRESLLMVCLDLFMAGSKTTTDTLASAFLFLSLNDEWLKILQTELDRVVGRSRAPTEEDLPYLPMMEAFLAEVQRYLILAPLGVPHRTMKDVSVNGYRIPEDTIVLFNLYSANFDETCWDQPNEFRPQRFLDGDGYFRHNTCNMPFGLGKRRCLGETLARSTIFLFVAYVVHYFDLEISPDHDEPRLDFYDGFTLSPKPYYLKLSRRSNLPRIFEELELQL